MLNHELYIHDKDSRFYIPIPHVPQIPYDLNTTDSTFSSIASTCTIHNLFYRKLLQWLTIKDWVCVKQSISLQVLPYAEIWKSSYEVGQVSVLRWAESNNTLNVVAMMSRHDIRGTHYTGARGLQERSPGGWGRRVCQRTRDSKLREAVWKGSSGAPSSVETLVSKGAALEVTWGPTRPGGMSPASAWGQALAPTSQWTLCGKCWRVTRGGGYPGTPDPPVGLGHTWQRLARTRSDTHASLDCSESGLQTRLSVRAHADIAMLPAAQSIRQGLPDHADDTLDTLYIYNRVQRDLS